MAATSLLPAAHAISSLPDALAYNYAPPQVLLVQTRIPSEPDVDPNLPILQYLASELEQNGRVSPIVWGQTDPLFRAAVEDRILKNAPEHPTVQQAKQAAGQLKADYLLTITVWHEGGVVKSRAQLFRKGSLVWADPSKNNGMSDSEQRNRKVAERLAKNQKVQVPDSDTPPIDPTVRTTSIGGLAEFNSENAARSIARTYAQLLAGDAFKAHPPRPTQATPEPDQGDKPIFADPPPTAAIDNGQVLAESDRLAAEGKFGDALTLLREAIDAEPLELARRQAYIKMLIQAGQPRQAASEARRTSELLPGGVELRVLGARCWLAAGDVAEAQRDANEALAREPGNAAVLALRGELQLVAGDIAGATDSLDASIAKAPSADAHFSRAVARALVGNSPAAKADMIESDRLSPLKDRYTLVQRYRMLGNLAMDTAERAGQMTRDLLQQARRDPKSPAVGAELAAKLAPLDGITALIDIMPAPEGHKVSQQRLLLALKLLTQSMSDLQSYLKTQDDDALGEATINLGEALKTLASARQIFKSEQ